MRKVVLVLGRTGSGKSYLTRSLVDRASRVLILDPRHEYEGQFFYDFQSLYTFIDTNNLYDSGAMRIVFRPFEDIDEEYLFRLARTMKNYLLVVEEAEEFLDPRSLNKDFKWMILRGRHFNISLLCVAQRWADISINFRAQATSIVTFQQIEPGDIQKMVAYGFNEDEIVNLNFEQHEYKFLLADPMSLQWD